VTCVLIVLEVSAVEAGACWRAKFVPRGSISIADDVRIFELNVVAQADSIGRGDANSGNQHAKAYMAAFDRLRSAGDEGRDALSVLLQHDRPAVRVKAAAYLLRHRTREAKEVLASEARGKGLTAFTAQQVLKRWEEGVWNLDPL
jgi:Domain of unknown function (DUF2019)